MIQKQPLHINFAQGLDTKTDPFQVAPGKFLSLTNTIFTKAGLLQKRNGYRALGSLPSVATNVTTLNGNLTALGNSVMAYNESANNWVSRGTYTPVKLSVLPLIRNSINQSQVDAALSANGLVCTVYTQSTNGSTFTYDYAIADSITGQNIVAPTAIIPSSGTVTGSPRVFLLGNYFVIVFTTVIGGISHLQYVAVSIANPTRVTTAVDISNAYASSTRLNWDGVVAGTSLYVAYNTTTGGQAIKVASLSAGLTLTTAVTFAGQIATVMSVTADVSTNNPVICVTYYDSAGSTGHILAVDGNLSTVLSPTSWTTDAGVVNLATVATGSVVTIYSERANAYSYDSGVPTNFINIVTVTLTGTVGTSTTLIRSVGLASKAILVNGTQYVLTTYQSPYQPTYFLINGAGKVVAKLAYENGGGYLTKGLPTLAVTDSTVTVPYLYKDLISAVNKDTNPGAGTQTAGIYSQTGINFARILIGADAPVTSSEIAGNLHLSGGFLQAYDGYLPVEHNFFVYPDSIEATWNSTGGAIAAQPDAATNTNAYWYQVTYEWSDNQGNIYRSAPSIPIAVTTTGTGVIGSITVNVPYLRLTAKTANPVKIVIYRWSVAQQIYYQVTSITTPVLNSTTSDSITFTDTLADATILGNSILYTTGGVVEDVNAPATNLTTLFDTRLWLVDAEDQNLLWFSKQIIEATPVEMSDLFTVYVAPTTGVQGSTGPITALSVMDDKLIIFKKDAIYYLNGVGPDNTGANNSYSNPTYITSTVGCANQASIVLMQNGLMFQSDKGIWLLGRGLDTKYIGAAVEQYNDSAVQSAVNVPETTQVRFTLDTGATLMYDYFYEQWGTFANVPAISSTVFQNLHTYVSASGLVFQESPGVYLDGGNPTLVSFTTSWYNLAGVQGYERAFFFYLLGIYKSPHKLNLSVSYDYNSSPSQSTLIAPINASPNYGTAAIGTYGQQQQYGGPGNIEQWRIFFKQQRCTSFQITLNEVYDPSTGQPPGAGLTLSGLNLVYGVKSGFRPMAASLSSGVK